MMYGISYQCRSDTTQVTWSPIKQQWNSKDKWVLTRSVVLVSGLRGSISFLLSDIKVHGSRRDLGRTANTESQDFLSSPDVTQISLARTLSTGNKWNTTKFNIWTELLSPLNRPALSTSAWLWSDTSWSLDCFYPALLGRELNDVWEAGLLNNSVLFMWNSTHGARPHLLGFTSVVCDYMWTYTVQHVRAFFLPLFVLMS